MVSSLPSELGQSSKKRQSAWQSSTKRKRAPSPCPSTPSSESDVDVIVIDKSPIRPPARKCHTQGKFHISFSQTAPYIRLMTAHLSSESPGPDACDNTDTIDDDTVVNEGWTENQDTDIMGGTTKGNLDVDGWEEYNPVNFGADVVSAGGPSGSAPSSTQIADIHVHSIASASETAASGSTVNATASLSWQDTTPVTDLIASNLLTPQRSFSNLNLSHKDPYSSNVDFSFDFC